MQGRLGCQKFLSQSVVILLKLIVSCLQLPYIFLCVGPCGGHLITLDLCLLFFFRQRIHMTLSYAAVFSQALYLAH